MQGVQYLAGVSLGRLEYFRGTSDPDEACTTELSAFPARHARDCGTQSPRGHYEPGSLVAVMGPSGRGFLLKMPGRPATMDLLAYQASMGSTLD